MIVCCGGCQHFSNDPAEIERRLPGIRALSSAYGTSRGQSGFCDLRALYLAPDRGCRDFVARHDEGLPVSLS